MSVNLVWITPEAEKNILYCARVSSNDQNSTNTNLINYLLKNGHISPFQMASFCVEVITTRDISAQIIRHRSLNIQEFSQRYQVLNNIGKTYPRRQDAKNRQNSFDDLDEETLKWWAVKYADLTNTVKVFYNEAIARGISKESARRILPMASETKLYIAATIRDWIFYLAARTDNSTQKEHRDLANQIKEIFKKELPIISQALGY